METISTIMAILAIILSGIALIFRQSFNLSYWQINTYAIILYVETVSLLLR